jgi:predicted aspartyl protease
VTGKESVGFRLSGLSLSNSKLNDVSLEGQDLVVTCTISPGDQTVKTVALVDCGATGYAFVNESFARHHNLPLHRLREERVVEVIDGRPIETGPITHLAKLPLNIHGHREQLPAFVTQLGHYPLVLGIPWLRRHDVAIRFSSNSVTFDSEYCWKNCIEDTVALQGTETVPAHAGNPAICAVNATGFRALTRHPEKIDHMGKITMY